MAVTLQQIAALAGVSRGTVDRVIHNRGRVNPEVGAKVRRIADELGYPYEYTAPQEPIPASRARIGVLLTGSETPVAQEMAAGAREAADLLREKGTQVLVRTIPGNDTARQLACLDELIGAGAHALALTTPSDPAVLERLRTLTESGLAVVLLGADSDAVDRLCYLGADNRKCGAAAAGLLRLMLPDGGKVLPLTGHPTSPAHRQRYASFAESFENAPDFELLPLQSCFNQDDFASEILLHTLEQYPDLRGVYIVAGGVHGICQALENAGLTGRLRVIGHDLTEQTRVHLERGSLSALLDQQWRVQGRRAVLLLAEYLTTGQLPDDREVSAPISILTRELL